MKYVRVNENLPPLSCAALGTDYYGKTIPESDARRLLCRYLELGGNVVDTAHVYSDYLPGEKHMSEKVIGRWMKYYGTRENIVLSTKGGFPVVGDMHASRIDRVNLFSDADESLDCLRTDRVDIYWLHRDDPRVPVSEIAGWMDELYRKGYFTCWGVSNWKHGRIEEIVKYCREKGLRAPVCSQIKWSLALPNPGSAGDDTLAEMDEEEHGWYLQSRMPVFAYSSQAKGFFWKLRSSENRGGVSDPGGKAGKRYYNGENIVRYRMLEELSAETGLSPGQLSIAWMTRPGTIPTVPIIGARTVSQLEDSMAGAAAVIPDEIAEKNGLFRRDRL
jgi:aryl-alcohol dehydrogenase-like predicted oxidoreductase